MPRYIDADLIKKKLQEKAINPATSFINTVLIGLLDDAPTADVVPKSEVDKLRQRAFEQGKRDNVYGLNAEELAQKVETLSIELEAMRGDANSYKMHYKKLAREIFEEISKASVDWGYYCVTLSKGAVLAEDVNRTLAELKKKYTEEK